MALLSGCRTGPPLAPIDLSEPGWEVRQGQALWKRPKGEPAELAGEVTLAWGTNAAYAQFSKPPFPLVTARLTGNSWELSAPAEDRKWSGRGRPPGRAIWLQLAAALKGQTAPGFRFSTNSNSVEFRNLRTGESLELYLQP